MARKLAGGFPANEAGAATSAVAKPAVMTGKRWLPMEFNADGTPNTDCLPAAKTVEKTRVRQLNDGTTFTEKVIRYVKAGEPRYSVSANNELIAWYRKRGGVGRKFVHQLKTGGFLDTKEGKIARARHTAFRAELRAHGIPGA